MPERRGGSEAMGGMVLFKQTVETDTGFLSIGAGVLRTLLEAGRSCDSKDRSSQDMAYAAEYSRPGYFSVVGQSGSTVPNVP